MKQLDLNALRHNEVVEARKLASPMARELKERRNGLANLFLQMPRRTRLRLHKQKPVFKVAKPPPLNKLNQNPLQRVKRVGNQPPLPY